MNLAIDTNVIVRSLVHDNPEQTALAMKIMREATMLVLSVHTLCELVWVLRRIYRFTNTDMVEPIESLLSTNNIVTNRPAAEAGLAFLKAGGDFANGVIAYEGRWLGAERFVSFDRKAVTLATAQGYSAQLLG